jgi:hypothetical protein
LVSLFGRRGFLFRRWISFFRRWLGHHSDLMGWQCKAANQYIFLCLLSHGTARSELDRRVSRIAKLGALNDWSERAKFLYAKTQPHAPAHEAAFKQKHTDTTACSQITRGNTKRKNRAENKR